MALKFTKEQLLKDKNTYTRLMSFMHPYRGRFILAILASIPASLLEGGIAFCIGPAVDMITKRHDLSILYYVPILILAIAFIQGIFEYISDYLSTWIGSHISQDIRRQLYNKLNTMDLSYYKQNSAGDVYTRFYADSTLLQQAIVDNFQGFIIQFFTLAFLAAVLIYRNVLLAVAALLIISLIIIPLSIISKKIRAMDYELRSNAAYIYDLFMETILGVKEIKGFQLQGFKKKRFNRALYDNTVTVLRTQKAAIILKPLMQMIAAIGIATIFLFGSYEVNSGHMTIGELTSFVIALVLLYKPIKVVGGIIGKVQRILAPAERVFEILSIEPKLADGETGTAISAFKTLDFKQVDFSYTPEKKILNNINLHIQAGEMVALVGPSGSGKSTLVDLIPRFMDIASGQILVNGTPLPDIKLNDYLKLFSIVGQEAVLFNGTIAENVRMGRLDATDDEVLSALYSANLKQLVESLPEGVNSPIGERGSMLSGGQRQRLAIARAFLKNAPVLILDEATSALDNESEAKVQDALNTLMSGRTVIVIAHRLSTIKHADRIVVLEQGRIVEMGTHEELLNRKELYHSLYYLQFRQHEARITP